jgi:protein phosphatase
VVLVIGVIVAALAAGYQWTQTRYFVGVADGTVAIYQGVQQDLGPIPLSTVVAETTIAVDDLPDFTRRSVEVTINADDLGDAYRIVERLQDAVD